MIRTLILTTLFGSLSLTVIADDPEQSELKKKPQYERLLKDGDAKKANEMEKRIKDFEDTDNYTAALQSARELLAMRTRIQGTDHYETRDADSVVFRLKKLVTLSTSQRNDFRIASRNAKEALTLESKGQYDQANPGHKRYLEICREIFGEDHTITAISYNNLAYNLEIQGKAAEARPLFQKGLEINRKFFGNDHPETATSTNNVAANLHSLGKSAEAQPLYQEALSIRRRVLGELNLETASSYNNVAYNMERLGKSAEAQQLFQTALNIRRQLLGDEHHETAFSYNNLAANLQTQGKIVEAQLLFQKAVESFLKSLGVDHPSTAVSQMNLAANLDSQGKFIEAQPLLIKALEINKKTLGENHPISVTNYNNIAANLNGQGKYTEAQRLYQKTLEIRQRIFGVHHPATASSYNNIGFNLQFQGKTTEAEPFHRNALAIRIKLFGEDHPETAESYNNLAVNLNSQGRTNEAEPLYQTALALRLKLLGEEHPATATSYNNLAVFLQLQGKPTEAQPFYQKALEIRRKILGEDHPQTANSYFSVASNLHALGMAAEAEPLYQAALTISRKVLGEDHPDTAQVYINLASNLQVQGKITQSEEILRQAIFSSEASRLTRARGIERAIGERFNPRLALAAIEQKKAPVAAWVNVEASLARGLLDQQTQSISNLTPNPSSEQTQLQSKITNLQAQILKLVGKAKQSNDESSRLKQLIRDRQEVGQQLATLAVAESERAVATGETIQAALPNDAALVYWVDVESRGEDIQQHFACVVRREGEPKWERLPGMGAEGKWTKEDSLFPGKLRTELSKEIPSQTMIESLAKKLHAQRIAPVLKHLDGVKTLYVVGVNEMAGVPVSLLTGQFSICYVPSGTFLARLMDQPKPTGSQFLAVGDAIYETEKKTVTALTDLPSGGILITQVIPMSAAAKAGLQVGDVILKYGEAEIAKLEDLQKASASTKAEKVSLTIWRDGEAKPFPVEIATGRMGVGLDREPAPVAIANRRKTEAMLASIRGGEWNDLPGTRVETNRLKQLFGESAKVFTDDNASEQTLESLRKSGELSKYRYLHFATHGEGNNVKAFESSLILSQDNLPKELMPKAGEPFMNGQLSAREVLDYWKLNAELVTLSACETAIGKSGGGDGLLGFAQAFLTAGARSVCLSLWKVDDTATALLMSRFYENLLGKREGLSKPMGKAAALDEAKRWLRGLSQEEALKLSAAISGGIDRGTRGKGVKVNLLPKAEKDEKPFAHPKYWAAFVLIGDPS